MRERVAAIIIQDGKLLVVRDDRAIDFGVPGGGLKPGESHEQALARELKEELQLELLSHSYVHTYDCQNIVLNVPQRTYAYIVEVAGDIVPDSEIEEWFWMDQSHIDAGEILFYSDELEHLYPILFKQIANL